MPITTEVPRNLQQVKKTLLKEFNPKKKKTVNSEKVVRYISNQGLEVKPFVIFDSDEHQKLVDIIGTTELINTDYTDKWGEYSQIIDLAIIKRNEESEELNGTIFTEGWLAHELAHASQMYRQLMAPTPTTIQTLRSGFVIANSANKWGHFIEEGFAEYYRGMYVANNISEEYKAKLASSMGYSNLEPDDTLSLTTPNNKLIPLPLKYFFLKRDNIACTDISIPGYGLELLFNKDPKLQNTLVQSRGSLRYLRAVAQRINTIHPGLYGSMQRSALKTEDFNRIILTIIDVLGGISRTINATGELKEDWETNLKLRQ